MIATRASATSETTRTPRRCRELCDPEPVRPPALRVSFRSARAVCSAGAIPDTTQATTHSSIVNAKMSPFIWRSIAIGTSVAGTRYPSDCAIHIANGAPAAAPMKASIRLSVRSCRTRRTRPAPSARRTPNSLCLAVARASSRLATFAQTINSTTPHTAIRISSGASSRVCAPECAFQMGSSVAPTPALVSGCSLASCSARAETSAFACCSVTPGFSRANPSRLRVWRSRSIQSGMMLSCGAITSGTHVSNASPGMLPRNSGGATPITVSCCRFTRSVLPIAFGSPLNRRFQRL